MCADACPVNALALGEEALELRLDICNGCMQCAAACPQQAIDPGWQQIENVLVRNGEVAYLTCARSGLGEAGQSIPCVHALSWRDALRLYAAGARKIVVALGECVGCDTRATRLENTVMQVNELLSSRSLPALELGYTSTAQWETAITEASATTATSTRRRAFLRRIVKPDRDERTSDTPATVQDLLGTSDSKSGVFPAVPVIDAQRCDGCDACTRVCASDAVALAGDQDLYYRVDASRCSGCRLCVDVCQPSAISVRRWTTSPQQVLELKSLRCRACGVEHHAPTASPGGLCHICSATHHHRKLFQVDPA